jgi:hypothetical protein
MQLQKKAYEEPKSGIFYMIPDIKTKKYHIYSEIAEPGEDVAHLLLWDKICIKLQMATKISAESFEPYYTGIPRGRIIAPYSRDGSWIIAIGNDFPFIEYKNDILSEFNMHDAESLGKVKAEFQAHEKMNPDHKKHVEKILGIEMTSTGFKKVSKK